MVAATAAQTEQWLRARLSTAQATLASFQQRFDRVQLTASRTENLTRDSAYYLFASSGDTVIHAAAQEHVCTLALAVLMGSHASVSFGRLQRRAEGAVRVLACHPKFTTSPCTNVAAQYELAAWAQILEYTISGA